MIQEEVDMFRDFILKSAGEPFDFINQWNLPILNALWRFTVGEKFAYDDPKLLSIIERLTKSFKRLGRPENIILFSFPWIAKIYPKFLERDQTVRKEILFVIIILNVTSDTSQAPLSKANCTAGIVDFLHSKIWAPFRFVTFEYYIKKDKISG